MIECLSPDRMQFFISILDNSIIEITKYSIFVIQTEVNDVIWLFNENKNSFCKANSV
jgi:hypothetical protein